MPVKLVAAFTAAGMSNFCTPGYSIERSRVRPLDVFCTVANVYCSLSLRLIKTFPRFLDYIVLNDKNIFCI